VNTEPIYVIPSYRRPFTVCRKTIKTLVDGGVSPTDIQVWVSDQYEREDYAKTLPEGVGLEVSAPTLRASRNFIARYYPVGTRLVWCDDDLEELIYRDNDIEYHQVRDIPDLVSEGFEAADAVGARLWGVYPTDNPLFMFSRVQTGLLFCIGVFYGHTLRGDDADLVDIHDKDDYERSIKCYLADGSCVRLEYVGIRTKYYDLPGGMQEYRTDRSAQRSAIIISRRYPKLATIYRRKGRDRLRLEDKRTALTKETNNDYDSAENTNQQNGD